MKLEFNPPDVWFDLYARLLPGVAFLVVLSHLGVIPAALWEGWATLFFLVGGFVIGLITNSGSSYLANLFQAVACWRYFQSDKDRLSRHGQRTSIIDGLVKAREQAASGWGEGRWKALQEFYGRFEAAQAKGRARTGYATHSKMHAEVVALTQMAVLSLVAAAVALAKWDASWWCFCVVALICLEGAYAYAFRRVRRVVTRIPGIAFPKEPSEDEGEQDPNDDQENALSKE